MNGREYVRLNCANDDTCEDSVYVLLTKLSRHTLQAYRSSHRNGHLRNLRNVQFTYDHDIKTIKRLRTKAFEILLKEGDGSVTSQDAHRSLEIDPLLELQKYAFASMLECGRSRDAAELELLLQQLERAPCAEIPVFSVLRLFIRLKSSNFDPEPLTNIFHCGKANPALPEVRRNAHGVPPFQIYPIECFVTSAKFEATLDRERFEISMATPTNIAKVTKEFNFSEDSKKQQAIIGIKSGDVSVAWDFMSNRILDEASSYSLLGGKQGSAINCELNLCVVEKSTSRDEWEKVYGFPWTRMSSEENASVVDADGWKVLDRNVTDERCNVSRADGIVSISIWKDAWNPPVSDHQTWERFGEIESRKETMFVTDSSIAAIHLEKIRQCNDLPLLSSKIMNRVPLLEKVEPREFLSDAKSMLLGIESNSFEYRDSTGFALRRNISVYGVSSESLEKICRPAVRWGDCFRFLSDLVTAKSHGDKLPQEGLIFKAMCANVKELLLYYQAVLLRIFTYENEATGLLKILRQVRPVGKMIAQVAAVCKPYKENRYIVREGSTILTRIYKQAIRVTDSKIALVFYSLLKSCCDVYFRFLQKWIFEGICDDIYGEFMIKTRPQYLRSRSHKFWTKSFSICKDAVPGFLTDLAESILECGKTVRLLKTCDSKNPVCHVCVTEQPEMKVCLSVAALREQSCRCREYEEKGKSALGFVLSLSTAILHEKQLRKKLSALPTERRALSTLASEKPKKAEEEEEKEGEKKGKGETPVASESNEREESEEVEPSSNKMLLQVEPLDEKAARKEETRYLESRRNILNYYENLANDINKRRVRSEWRVKRMKLYDKRVDALYATKQALKEGSNCPLAAPSYQDENKNYTETCFRPFVLDATRKSYTRSIESVESIESDGEVSTTSGSCQVNRVQTDRSSNRNNDNYNYNYNNNGQQEFGDFAEVENANAEQLDEILTNASIGCPRRSSTIERPTFLNVIEVDNSMLECVRMTPNNNELEVRGTSGMSEIELERESGSKQGAEQLETPMSCTTDNFISPSVQSPISQAYNADRSSPSASAVDSAVDSPMDVSSMVAAGNCDGDTKCAFAMKKDSTFSDLFELADDERNNNVLASGARTSLASLSSLVSLSVTDVEIIDHISLQAYLEKSIRTPLNVQSQLVNNAVIKYFLNENKLLSHLHSLRSYFFLLNGEFAKSLTDSLYAHLYRISVPIELFNSATLTNLLERALVNSFNNVYANSELLSLSATDTPAQLHMSDPTALDCLSLNYKISWPLNVILDEAVMQQYGKVFKFLITSGRVAWVLQEDFNIMKRERNAVESEQYHKLQLYRHSMTQFMNALHTYLTCSVLHASWAEFEKDLQHSLTVDQIYLSHVNYIKRILSRCMLNSRGEKVRICLNNIFKVILKFHNRVRSQSWQMKYTGYAHPNFKKLEQMYRAFCELRAYMAHVAFKLATSGYQPHLMHFLNALNMNHLYDLTVKS